MAVTNEENKAMDKVSDYCVYLPETNPYFANSLAIIPLQALRILCGGGQRLRRG